MTGTTLALLALAGACTQAPSPPPPLQIADKYRAAPEPVLSPEDAGATSLSCPRLLIEDGQRTLLFRAVDQTGSRILRARADGEAWVLDPTPLLSDGDPGCFTVTPDDGGYRVWLSMSLGDDRHGLVEASSESGRPMELLDQIPAFVPQPDWTHGAVHEPFVLREPDGYRFFARCGPRIGGSLCTATSPDGHAWTLHPEPLLTGRGGSRSGRGEGWGAPWAVLQDGAYHLWITHRIQREHSEISLIRYASTADPTVLPDGHLAIVLKAGDAWRRQGVESPSLAQQGGRTLMAFVGRGPDAVGSLGLAVGEERPRTAAAAPSPPRPDGDPTTPGSATLIRDALGAEIVVVGDALLRLVPIPASRFVMGSPEDEAGRDQDEDRHLVTISRGFLMAETEIPQGLYGEVSGGNPSAFRGVELPVESVSWYQAVTFCNLLSEAAGLEPAYTIEGREIRWDPASPGFRLPTEAEWEHAARAGVEGGRYASAAPLSDHAWFAANSAGSPQPVGTRLPNPWGLYDMNGNVYEWCWDWRGRYPDGPVTDPAGPAGPGELKRERGGSFRNGPDNLRVANRGKLPPDESSMNLGFRIVRTP